MSLAIPNAKLNTVILKSKARQEMVEVSGRLSQIVGFPRSTGQIYGLLYFSSIPLSLGDICEILCISKASTSTGSRQLVILGAIRKVWIPGERKDYYEASEDLIKLITGSYRTLVRPKINSSESRLATMEESLKDDYKMKVITNDQYEFILKRLANIKRIHGKISKLMPIFEKILN